MGKVGTLHFKDAQEPALERLAFIEITT